MQEFTLYDFTDMKLKKVGKVICGENNSYGGCLFEGSRNTKELLTSWECSVS